MDETETANRKSNPTIQDVGGIAGALARALEERRKNMMMHSDGSDNSDSSDGANDSEWEDE